MPDPILRLVDDSGAVERFTPTGPPDAELEWFFTMAESDMGARSNFTTMVGQHDGRSIDMRAEAARARRTILEWLVEIRDPHAGVLQAAYEARPWPLALREALGRTTGVLARLASADGGGFPDDEGSRALLDLQAADRLTRALVLRGATALEPFRLRAGVLLRGAFLAYERARGGPARPRLRGTS
jgi:hypothetical protein